MAFIVAIDGPAGTGKGTVTERISKKKKLLNIDTGATYRCVTLAMQRKNIQLDELEKIKELLDQIDINMENQNGTQRFFLDGEDVSEEIRSKEVTKMVSQVSSIKEVRIKMVDLQRKLAEGKDVIMEGRDIGTYVFPKADVKIYLDADEEERARRRVKQNQEKGINMSYEEVLENIRKRDENDKNKEMGALKVAEDATVIDTTNLTIDEVVKKVEELIEQKKTKIKKEEKLEKVAYYERKETRWKKFLRGSIKGFLAGLYHIAFHVKVTGKVPDEGAYIICANHINYLDAAAIILLNKRKVRFVAKEDLYRFGILAWLGHLFDIIPIKRNKQDLESMKRCMKALKNGELLGIFPEGTRKGLAKNQKVKNGAAFMALRTNTKVIPVGIHGKFKFRSKIYINYGEPLDFSELKDKANDKEVMEEVSKKIMDQIIQLSEKE